MSITSSSNNRRSPVRSVALMVRHSVRRRNDGEVADRNTSPTDFVLRDYRYVR